MNSKKNCKMYGFVDIAEFYDINRDVKILWVNLMDGRDISLDKRLDGLEEKLKVV